MNWGASVIWVFAVPLKNFAETEFEKKEKRWKLGFYITSANPERVITARLIKQLFHSTSPIGTNTNGDVNEV